MYKLTFTIKLALVIVMSCQTTDNSVRISASNEKLIRNYFDLFNKHQWPVLAALYTDTASFKDPSMGPGLVKQTRQQIITKYTELGELFPNIHDEVIALHPSNQHIIVEFVSTGTGSDGVSFTLPICTVFTIENGKIVGDFTYYDNIDNPQ